MMTTSNSKMKIHQHIIYKLSGTWCDQCGRNIRVGAVVQRIQFTMINCVLKRNYYCHKKCYDAFVKSHGKFWNDEGGSYEKVNLTERIK